MKRVPSPTEVIRRRKKLEAAIAVSGRTDLNARVLADAVVKVLPKASYRALLQSCSWVSSARDKESVAVFCSSMAGNYRALQEGKTVVPGVWPREAENVLVRIRSVSAISHTTNKFKILMRVMSGSPAPLPVSLSASVGFCQKLACDKKTGLGLYAERDRRYSHPSELAGCYATAAVCADGSSGRVVLLWASKSQADRNRKLFLMRLRLGFTCPENFNHACYVCPKGTDVCPAACRSTTLVAGVCKFCDQRGWIGDGPCLKCRLHGMRS